MKLISTLMFGVALIVSASACGKDKKDDEPGAPTKTSALDRPRDVERPPSSGLPDDLRPPR